MTQEFAIYIVRETLFTAIILAAPMLLSGLLIGLIISMIQSATQINEMTLTFIPKILVVVVVMIVAMPWIINRVLLFTHMIYGYIAQMTR
ncbi:MAG: flagellar biosynthetic protein FliQ [Candidatus Electryonea clarkiae]|nr:flagellar biosynthetic protein FliQ [Candidatus Electryonea clarkiae]MDP8287316.1 flagellar biosynthetic protein FliQ [Candidatus Electryonea clarkiae]